MITALVGAQFHRHHVRACIGFAHGQRANVFAADQPGQVTGLLLRASIAIDLVNAQVGMGTIGQRHRRRATADFFHRHDVRQITQARATVFFADSNPQYAHFTELAPHVGGEQIVLVDLRCAWGKLCGDEGLQLIAQHVDGFAQGEVQAGVTHGAFLFCS